MTNMSRVKKYQELRNEVLSDREEDVVSPALSSYADRLKKINPVLSSVNTSDHDANYRPLHTKREAAFSSKIVDQTASHSDLMGEFLEEVKAYNLEKGYRADEEQKVELVQTNSLNETAVQQELPITDDTLDQEIRRIIQSDFKDVEEGVVQSQLETTSSTDLHAVVEETQKMRAQLTEYEKGLVDMNESVLSSNRILNIIVFVLVLVLMIMLGIAIYWVLNSKGFY